MEPNPIEQHNIDKSGVTITENPSTLTSCIDVKYPGNPTFDKLREYLKQAFELFDKDKKEKILVQDLTNLVNPQNWSEIKELTEFFTTDPNLIKIVRDPKVNLLIWIIPEDKESIKKTIEMALYALHIDGRSIIAKDRELANEITGGKESL